jgi:hypothetical protein
MTLAVAILLLWLLGNALLFATLGFALSIRLTNATRHDFRGAISPWITSPLKPPRPSSVTPHWKMLRHERGPKT